MRHEMGMHDTKHKTHRPQQTIYVTCKIAINITMHVAVTRFHTFIAETRVGYVVLFYVMFMWIIIFFEYEHNKCNQTTRTMRCTKRNCIENNEWKSAIILKNRYERKRHFQWAMELGWERQSHNSRILFSIVDLK